MRIQTISILLVFLLLLGGGTLHALPPDNSGQNSPGKLGSSGVESGGESRIKPEFLKGVLKKGAEFRHPLLSIRFRSPSLARYRLVRRGSFYSLKVNSLVKSPEESSYMLLYTPFFLRDPAALKRPETFRGSPCPAPAFPDPVPEQFRVESRCQGEVEGVKLLRRVLYIKKGDFLHTLYLALPLKSQGEADGILSTLRMGPNPPFP